MSQHPPDPLLERFVSGEVPESLAVEMALHLDECIVCASRTAVLEPLAGAFACSPDPVPPSDLVAQIFEELDKPNILPELPPLMPGAIPLQAGAELLAGAILLSVAGSLFLLLGEPEQLAVDLVLGAHAAATAASIGASSLDGVSAAWPAMLAGLGFAGCLWAASTLQRHSLHPWRREP